MIATTIVEYRFQQPGKQTEFFQWTELWTKNIDEICARFLLRAGSLFRAKTFICFVPVISN